ncbi:MAG: ABC transporter permease [Clostridia bacterium]
MKATLTLFTALIRQTVRNRQGLFWTLFFPVVLMVVFSFLGNSQSHTSLAVVEPPGVQSPVVSVLKKSPVFAVHVMSRKAAFKAVQAGQMDAVLIVPSSTAAATGTLTLRYNNANLLASEQTVGAIQAFIAQADVALSGRPPAYRVTASPLAHSRAATYLDFLLPGVLALMVMQNSLFGIGSGLTRWKEKGILRRFRVTPLRPAEFLGATVLNYIAVGLATSAIIIGIAVGFLHASIVLPIASVVLVLLLGMASFLSIGFIVAGISKTQEATIPIVNLISFPMMFLSGIFFPVSSLPKVLAHIVNYFPLTYLAGALRGLMSGQLTLAAAALRTDLLGMVVWLVATGVIAARVWRWE